MRIDLAIAAILILEGAIFAWALSPDVDPAFRAFFIERTSDCYPLEVSGSYRLGERVSFSRDADNGARQALARCGWRDPGPLGAWSDGTKSRLRFTLDASTDDLVLELELTPFVTEGLPSQRLTIRANDTPVADLVLTEYQVETIKVPISRRLLAPAGTLLDITLTLPDARSPADLGIGKDEHRYAIHLASLRLSKAD